ncbi:MAG: thermonuclease family protein [Candidatus Thermoplasmatota archaeon]|nr:thermonuclease family protein [Candidatus Thermoplasmatota archaeon]
MPSHMIIIGDSRSMNEIQSDSVDLVVTSPPYWSIRDYGSYPQIGFGQTLHDYLKDLYLVWKECYRVLKDGTRLSINVGDQFLRSSSFGRYKVLPIHSEIILQCEKIGYDYMGAIIWQKKTTMNTSGGSNIMGSYPYPPNGLLEIDYEYILIFKKPGKRKDVTGINKSSSVLSKEEWKEYFSGHWTFPGERKNQHEAMFPEELPARLIRMFSFTGETILDPFLGSGTTLKAACDLGRNSIGYEINEHFLIAVHERLKHGSPNKDCKDTIDIIRRNERVCFKHDKEYMPSLFDIDPPEDRSDVNFNKKLQKVQTVTDKGDIILNDGTIVGFLGVDLSQDKIDHTIEYLKKYVKGKMVMLQTDPEFKETNGRVLAYVYLKNRIFVNKELIRMGYGNVSKYNFKKRGIMLKVLM